MNAPVGAPKTWPGAGGVDPRRAHQAEDGVARSKGDRQAALANEARTDQAARIIAGPDHDAAPAASRSGPASTARAVPTIDDAGAIAGSFIRRLGAVAVVAASHHVPDARSMRFMPEPSPGSIGA